jgi:hypothetical protein
MKRILNKPFILSALLATTLSASAFDIELDGIHYNIISATEKTVMTTPGNDLGPINNVVGELVLPETVVIRGETYKVTEIGRRSFMNNSALTSVTFPASITKVGYDAFRECSNLSKVEAASLQSWCNIDFEMDEGAGYGISSNPLMYANHLFVNGIKVIDLIIPNEVTEIKDWVFAYMTGLKSVKMPASVTTIGARAFLGCNSLYDVALSENLTAIGTGAFYQTNLQSIVFPESLKTIDDGAFSETPLVLVEIPDGVENMGKMAFKDCKELKTVVIGNGLRTIPERAFDHCSVLRSVTFGNSVEKIMECAFQCTDLREVMIPNSVTTIGDGAFISCASLETLELPSGLTSIGRYAFEDCSSLKKVCSYATAPPVCGADDSFRPSADCVLHIPKKTKEVYKESIGWKNFAYLEDDLPNENYVGATDITLDSNTLRLKIGDSYQLAATVLPENATDKSVIWSSSDSKVASVSDNGLVKGLKEGHATITATCDGISATCDIEVTDFSGITSVATNGANSVEVYTLQGQKIDRPLASLETGIYIIVHDGRATKVKVE